MMHTRERFVVEKLLEHAAAVACLGGPIGDNHGGVVVDRLADNVDEIVHELTELRARPSAVRATTALASLLVAELYDRADVS